RTRRRLGLTSQAAYRFERRVDPMIVPEALDAVAMLVARVARGRVAPGIVEQAADLAALAPSPIRIRPSRASALLGITVPRAEIARRRGALGAGCRRAGDVLVVTPPSPRADLVLEEDLIEEVVRVGGYDAVPATLPVAPVTIGDEGETR